MNTKTSISRHNCQSISIFSITRCVVILLYGLLLSLSSNLSAQPTTQSPPQVTLEGTLTMYMVTRYGDSLQEIDRYRKTTKEGEYVAFILKTDKKMDLEQYLDKEDVEALREYCGETLQSEFMLVPD